MSSRAVKSWYLVHKWTSLICTVFLLMLCITGLPLIFYPEIEAAIGEAAQPRALPPGVLPASLDRIVSVAEAQQSGDVVQYVTFDEHDPNVVYVTLGATAAAEDTHYYALDTRTAEILNVPQFADSSLYIFYRLHADMFAGLPGELFLGAMGLLFVAAIVSGAIVYGPFMRRLDFGTVRKTKTRRTMWFDVHNLVGIVTLIWALVVGVTGVLNTLGTPILQMWQLGQLSEMIAPYKDRAPPVQLSSLATAVATANRAAPDLEPSFIAYPGTLFSSNFHYAVFLRGKTPLTSRLFTPGLIDAETGALSAMRDVPWYVSALFVSRPLHFGDYGGLPLKILWAMLDIVTILVLGSGVYLWLGRRRSPMEARLAEILGGGASTPVRLEER